MQEKEGIKEDAQFAEEDMVTIEKTNVANWPYLDIEYYMNFERSEADCIQLHKDPSKGKLQQAQETTKDVARRKANGGREKELLRHYQMPSEEEMAGQLDIDEIIPQKTMWTDALHPKLDIKIKLKMNNGFQTFKQSKKIQPIKFIYKNFETEVPHVHNEQGGH